MGTLTTSKMTKMLIASSNVLSSLLMRKPRTVKHTMMDTPISAPMMRNNTAAKRGRDTVPEMRAAVLPRNVLSPVRTTVASASPRTTAADISTSPPRSSGTGSDSPVSALWSTSTWPPLSTQSAGTVAPAPSFTRSPGTTSADGVSRHSPSRFANVLGCSDALSADTASSARLAS